MRDALKVQEARTAAAAARASEHYYVPGQFDLSDLPAYVPRRRTVDPSGSGRPTCGDPGFQEKLEAAFRKLQPNASIVYASASPSGAFAGLLTQQADVAMLVA